MITFLYVNRDIKKAMYDSIPRDQICNLISRCVQSLIIKTLQYELMRYFKLTTISLIANLSPLFTLFLGFLVLKENVSRSDVMQIFGSVLALVLIFFGMQIDKDEIDATKKTDEELIKEDSQEYAKRDHYSLIVFVLLLSMPIGIAL